jgi:hypothetical protein
MVARPAAGALRAALRRPSRLDVVLVGAGIVGRCAVWPLVRRRTKRRLKHFCVGLKEQEAHDSRGPKMERMGGDRGASV